MEPTMILIVLSSAWGVVTGVLFVLLVHRSLMSSREDDQIFIDAAEQHHFEEQKEVIARMTRLEMPIIALAAISAVLFLSVFSVWLYQSSKNL
jgi:small neutral amino acid transporter SnatA (MarC family)